MLVHDLDNGAIYKLNRINALLEQMYGIRIDYNNSPEHLRQVFEHYQGMRALITHRSGITGLQNNPKYTKAVLISEAVRIYLREIAPKRNRKRKR